MNNFAWNQYNNKKKLILNLIDFNKKHKISYIEKGIYNHIRDIFCLSLMFVKMLSKNNKIRILDYGSNALAYANIVNKINCKNISFRIFDPFNNKLNYKLPLDITFFKDKKILKNNNWDMVYFGSSLQYIDKFNNLKDINFKKTKLIFITHTPISLMKSYKSTQSNHKNLTQYVHSFKEIESFMTKNKFKLIFKSRNTDKVIDLNKKQKKTYSLNLLFVR